MSIETVVAQGRAARESLMLDRCTITEPDGVPVFDEATGTYTAPPRVTVYAGRCRVQVKDQTVVESTSGEREWAVQTSTLELPVRGTEKVRAHHVATITYAALDPALLGRQYQIQASSQKSQAVCRRYRVKETSG